MNHIFFFVLFLYCIDEKERESTNKKHYYVNSYNCLGAYYTVDKLKAIFAVGQNIF